MGQIFAYFHPAAGFDFEKAPNVPPSDDEEAARVWEEVSRLLETKKDAYEKLKTYQGNGEIIRESMANPKDEAKQIEGFEGMFPNINRIKSLFLLSKDTNACIQKVITKLSESENEETKAALLKGLASLLEQIFNIDWAKMHKPEIQNDFSFYRRSLEKHSSHPELPVDDAVAGHVSMFVAQANPFIKSIITSLETRKREGGTPEIIPFLSNFTNMCAASAYAAQKGNQCEDNVNMLYAAMTVCIVLYDSLEPNGAFTKHGRIDIKKCINGLNSWDSEKKTQYLNSLKYSTRTFQKAPNSVQKLF
eukprot:CAMPEP_0204827340 /NCGR_PEP_ID=MMETSP1346-20131115/4819_1 /ASSEMBLY_ACC=CAM_ASM_000771 /TAXON_ID=215587 /ORGANISM="Aplanochytrium stocchinoi, Strain GSBS06" /LENGTH=304 /DNA_ID=CAMNT_0051955715 /DNA_START=189 /DNA_END=1100 /DNA_ORIENTATION=-